jgi:hypothetical protein
MKEEREKEKDADLHMEDGVAAFSKKKKTGSSNSSETNTPNLASSRSGALRDGRGLRGVEPAKISREF